RLQPLQLRHQRTDLRRITRQSRRHRLQMRTERVRTLRHRLRRTEQLLRLRSLVEPPQLLELIMHIRTRGTDLPRILLQPVVILLQLLQITGELRNLLRLDHGLPTPGIFTPGIDAALCARAAIASSPSRYAVVASTTPCNDLPARAAMTCNSFDACSAYC